MVLAKRFLPNAELLALAAKEAKMALQKTLRRASRKAFMWQEEAALMVEGDHSLISSPLGSHLFDQGF